MLGGPPSGASRWAPHRSLPAAGGLNPRPSPECPCPRQKPLWPSRGWPLRARRSPARRSSGTPPPAATHEQLPVEVGFGRSAHSAPRCRGPGRISPEVTGKGICQNRGWTPGFRGKGSPQGIGAKALGPPRGPLRARPAAQRSSGTPAPAAKHEHLPVEAVGSGHSWHRAPSWRCRGPGRTRKCKVLEGFVSSVAGLRAFRGKGISQGTGAKSKSRPCRVMSLLPRGKNLKGQYQSQFASSQITSSPVKRLRQVPVMPSVHRAVFTQSAHRRICS